MMNRRDVATSLAIAFMGLASVACAAEGQGGARGKPTASAAPAAQAAPKLIVYYFHGTFRCQTCRTIEAYSGEAIKAAFGSELSSGEIQWKPTNVDEGPNAHFVKDYQLFTRSLVVVDGANSKRFKNLEKVWQLVGDKPAFVKYVQDEVRAFRKS